MAFLAWYLSGIVTIGLINYFMNKRYDTPWTYGDILFIALMGFGGLITVIAGVFLCFIHIVAKIIDMDFWNRPLFKDED